MNCIFGKNKKSLFTVLLIIFLLSSCGPSMNSIKPPLGTPPEETVDDKYYKNEWSVALFYAVKRRDISGVREALEKGADPNVADRLGLSALMWACWYEMPDIVDALITVKTKGIKSWFNAFKHKININQVSSQDGMRYTALLCAAEAGRSDIFIKLTDRKADIRAVDRNKETILHKAVKSNNPANIEMVEHILKLYKDKYTNTQDINGFTPLHRAVIKGDRRMVGLLLENKADAYLPAKKNELSIHPLYSAFEERNYLIYCDLLENLTVIQVNQILDVYDKPLQLSLEESNRGNFNENDFRIIKAYLNNLEEANLKYPNRYSFIFSASQKTKGLTLFDENFKRDAEAFYIAVKNDDRNTFKELIKSIGVNLIKYSHEGEDGQPILNAIRNNNDEMVYDLLGLNFGTQRDNDALAFAASIAIDTKDYKILDYLLSRLNIYGEKLYSRKGTSGGKTALTYILQNDDYLFKKGFREINRIFDSLWRFQDKHKEQIIYYVIELKTDDNDDQTKNELIKVKNNLFELVSNTEIQINSTYDTKDITRGYIKDHILVHLLEKKYYHGVNHLLRNPKYKPEELKYVRGGIFEQIIVLLPSADEINNDYVPLLKNFINEVKQNSFTNAY